MPTGEDTHGRDYFTPVFLLPQLCNSTVHRLSRCRALTRRGCRQCRARARGHRKVARFRE
ncbi:hypothetical protein EKI59_11555 [Corynebacterium sanguinis]|uniref:Uncharacterized protein n=1 Tax=Corynebacterium sanguinis TaxID=2594913 RepID=A0A6C1TU66_9CORY|nr:hypothetical protein EKI50_04250 [Corynebacterium sanguinis]TVS25065.1 hypothetical protein EKI59_11555 [Corynebacterium sanguinis]